MKMVSIHELDEATQKLIRQAATEETVVMDQGVVVAEIKVPIPPKPRARFTKDHWAKLSSPRIDVDSTDIISEDRDR